MQISAIADNFGECVFPGLNGTKHCRSGGKNNERGGVQNKESTVVCS